MAFPELSTQVFPINMEETDLENNSVRMTKQCLQNKTNKYPLRDRLITSHIFPWSHNSLCTSTTQDNTML